MKNQLHVVHAYMDAGLYDHCSILAKELSLSNSSFLKMVVSKAWNERKGGDKEKISDVVEKKAVKAAVVDQKALKMVELQDKEFEDLTKPVVRASKVSVMPAVRYQISGKGRRRHKSKIKEE